MTSRDTFREEVLKRDQNRCVICKSEGKLDAHHIIERRLWEDGGYHIQNGAALCEKCHFDAEKTLITPEQIREAAGIKEVILPDHLYPDNVYTKWGDICLPNGCRCKGELFFDPSVQRVLAAGNVLHLYTDRVKYPRTYHLPKSLGRTKDDRVLPNTDNFIGKRVIVTEKLDGENTTLGRNYVHARSVDSKDDFTKHWIKNFQNKIGYNIPEGWRICGENLWAIHSIEYKRLNSYFYGFSIWNEKNICLSWNETIEWFELLEINSVPVLYDGVWDEDKIYGLYEPVKNNGDEMEGFVVRIAESFSYGQFRKCVAKMVRENHVQTNEHWKKKVKQHKIS